MNLFRTVLRIVWLAVLALYVKFKDIWLRWNKFTFEGAILPANPDNRMHKILLLGDGLAEGYGDDRVMAMFMPGITWRLSKKLAHTPQIRQTWQVVSCGKVGSTSEDWLPGGPLYKDMLKSFKYGDANFVLLMVGAEDFRNGIRGQDTLKNIKKIAEDLSERGKVVYIATIPRVPKETQSGEPRLIPEKADVDFLNESIPEYVSTAKNKNIRLGADLGSYELYWRKDFYISEDLALVANSLLHFNNKGYEKCVELWHEVLVNDIVKVEFAIFSKALLR